MDYGCYNGPDSDGDGYSDGSVPVGYTAYEREFCGWITIEELTAPSSVTLENLADSKKAYKIVSSVLHWKIGNRPVGIDIWHQPG